LDRFKRAREALTRSIIERGGEREEGEGQGEGRGGSPPLPPLRVPTDPGASGGEGDEEEGAEAASEGSDASEEDEDEEEEDEEDDGRVFPLQVEHLFAEVTTPPRFLSLPVFLAFTLVSLSHTDPVLFHSLSLSHRAPSPLSCGRWTWWRCT
jgi:hypothetical protein